MLRLGFLTSHPIQYQAPLFRALTKRLDLCVYFAHNANAKDQAKTGFGINFDWDTDLLSGYNYQWLDNIAKQPDIGNFNGCDTPGIDTIIAKQDFDAFIVNGWYLKTFHQAAAACRQHGIPVLARTDSIQLIQPIWKPLLKRLIQPRVLNRFDAFLTVGIKSADYLRQFGIPNSRILYAPHCIDTDLFSQASNLCEADRQVIRQQWGIAADDECKVLLYVGKFITRKRVKDLLQASAELIQQGHNLHVVLVGAGDLERSLCQLIDSLKIPVRIIGFKNQTELPAIYAAADLFVLPSNIETWGLVVNEAMACGIPAVVSDQVGCIDLVEDGITGTIYPCEDIHALGQAISSLLPKLGQPAIAKALKHKTQLNSPQASAVAIHTALQSFVDSDISCHAS